MGDALTQTKAARARREACHEAGMDQGRALIAAGSLNPPDDWDAYDRYLWLIGVANVVTARARALGQPDTPRAVPLTATTVDALQAMTLTGAGKGAGSEVGQ